EEHREPAKVAHMELAIPFRNHHGENFSAEQNYKTARQQFAKHFHTTLRFNRSPSICLAAEVTPVARASLPARPASGLAGNCAGAAGPPETAGMRARFMANPTRWVVNWITRPAATRMQEK